MASASSIEETMLSEFDYFAPLPVQGTLVDEYDDPIQPTALTARNVLEFVIPANSNVYRDLNNTLLIVKCKVTNANNTDLAADAAVSPVNYLLHSLFSSVDVSLCNTVITDKSPNYPYRAFIETLMTYDDDVHKMRGASAGWCLDTDAAAMDRILVTAANNVDPNPAFLTRRKQIHQSRSLTLGGYLHNDLFRQNLNIPPDCSIVVTLTPTEDKFALIAAADATFKISLTAATLYVRTKTATPDLIMAHRRMLDTCNFRFPYDKVKVQQHTVSANSTEASFPNLFPDRLPKRVILGLATQARTGGTFNLNPFKFENFGVKNMTLKVTGQGTPRDGLAMDYTAGDFTRAYLSSLDALGLSNSNRATSLTPELWSTAYNLYAFKLVAGPIDEGPMLYTQMSGTVNLNITFANAPTEALTLFVYSETPSLLEITKLNTVLLS